MCKDKDLLSRICKVSASPLAAVPGRMLACALAGVRVGPSLGSEGVAGGWSEWCGVTPRLSYTPRREAHLPRHRRESLAYSREERGKEAFRVSSSPTPQRESSGRISQEDGRPQHVVGQPPTSSDTLASASVAHTHWAVGTLRWGAILSATDVLAPPAGLQPQARRASRTSSLPGSSCLTLPQATTATTCGGVASQTWVPTPAARFVSMERHRSSAARLPHLPCPAHPQPKEERRCRRRTQQAAAPAHGTGPCRLQPGPC